MPSGEPRPVFSRLGKSCRRLTDNRQRLQTNLLSPGTSLLCLRVREKRHIKEGPLGNGLGERSVYVLYTYLQENLLELLNREKKCVFPTLLACGRTRSDFNGYACMCACFLLLLLSLSGGARSSSRLHTCVLRPAPVVYGYGTPERDR